MEHKTANPSIECTVSSCAYHCSDKQFCSLDAIKVGCQANNVGSCDCTECASFRLGDHGTCCK